MMKREYRIPRFARLFVVGAVVLFSLFVSTAISQTAGAGRTFTICLPQLSPSTNGGAERIHLAFTSDAGASVSIFHTATGAVQSLFVPANSSAQIVLDTNDLALPNQEGIFNRSIRVVATAPVTASVVLDRGTASEAYGSIPDSLLGLEYLAVGSQSFGPGSFVVVAATEDETTVTITPTKTTLNDRPAGVPFTVMLHKGQVYQLLSKPRLEVTDDDDLSGTRVIADRPIAVWSGTTCSRFPVGNITCGPLLEQLPSIDMQGTFHPLGLYQGEQQTFYHVVAPYGGTVVQSVEALPNVDTLLPVLGGLDFNVTFQSGEIVTSVPALVAHLGVNISEQPPQFVDSAVGDPTMGIVTPVEQMATLHRFVIPTLFARSDGRGAVGWKHFVNVARASPTTAATLDGVPLAFVGNYASTGASSGEHAVRADGPVSVTINGRSVSDAYAFVPAPVVRTWPLRADSLAANMCGDEIDTVIMVANDSPSDITIDAVEFLVGLQGELVDPPLPFTIPSGRAVPVRFRIRNLLSGQTNGSIVLRSGLNRYRVLRIPVWLRPDRLEFDPPSGSGVLDFPLVFPSESSDLTITLTNPARYPVTVLPPELSPAQFTVVSPAFPLTIPAGESRKVTLRYTSNRTDRVVPAQVIFRTANCLDEAFTMFNLQGVVKRLQAIEPAPRRLLCEPKPRDTLTVEFVNRGDGTIRFDEVTIRGHGEFALLPGATAPVVLRPGDSVRFRVLYVPGPLGLREAHLYVKGAGEDFDSLGVPLRVQNDLLRIVVDPSEVDLGNKACDSATARRIAIVNTGNVPASGMSVNLIDGSLARLAADVPDEFALGDTLFAVVFAPDSLYGQLFDTVRVFVPECGAEFLIPVQSRCAVGTIEIAWGDEEGEIGKTVAMPLRMTASPPTFAQNAQVRIRVVGHMKRDMLLPSGLLSDVPEGLSAELIAHRVEGEQRVVEMELSGTLPSSGVLATMEALALLGSDSVTAVTIDTLDFRFQSDVFEGTIASRDGSFRTLGLCYVNHARLIDASGSFAMRVAPNPAAGVASIEVDLVEDGPTSLRLANQIGETVLTLFDEEMSKGRWHVSVPLDGIPEGAYRLLLTTATQTISEEIRVVR